MKKITIAFLLIIISNVTLWSHNQDRKPVHQRIVLEAYNLLKLQLSKEDIGFADMDNFIGEAKIYNEYYWHKVKTVADGAEHEDRYDVVYKNGGAYASITHFFYPDDSRRRMYFIGHKYATAYSKANRYVNDDYTMEFKFPHSGGETAGYLKRWCLREPESQLYDWYWKDKIYVNYSHQTAWWKAWIPYDKRKNYDWNVGNQFCREIFYNLLGRTCHLLTDMGVPEHAKQSSHIFWGESPYEHWICGMGGPGGGPKAALFGGNWDYTKFNNEFYWTAERVYKERGGFVDPFCELDSESEIGFLFYTLAQLSDWFSSYGRNGKDGNALYDPSIGEIQSIINSYFPTELNTDPFDYFRMRYAFPLPNDVSLWKLTDIQGRIFRDALLPYTIRAVAGLLYKYIIETRMQYPNAATGKGSVFDQQQELNLYNQDIDGDHYTFRAEGLPGRITVCPPNRPAGYPADFVIGTNARNVTFRAANEIVFEPGFTATFGSEVHAYIGQPGVNCEQCLQEDYNPQYDRRP